MSGSLIATHSFPITAISSIPRNQATRRISKTVHELKKSFPLVLDASCGRNRKQQNWRNKRAIRTELFESFFIILMRIQVVSVNLALSLLYLNDNDMTGKTFLGSIRL
ncbi:unnamed protein product [Citrullus colocynthis]|uniref:Uncharacterized protein n=1 Tax=Citrullus colocynthis TaxID=252529 RepID=A0ABP0XSQ7_9ROSI